MVFSLAERVPAVGISFDRYYDQKLNGVSTAFGVANNVLSLDSASMTGNVVYQRATEMELAVEVRQLEAQTRAPLHDFLR